jgi:hypothetical protein
MNRLLFYLFIIMFVRGFFFVYVVFIQSLFIAFCIDFLNITFATLFQTKTRNQQNQQQKVLGLEKTSYVLRPLGVHAFDAKFQMCTSPPTKQRCGDGEGEGTRQWNNVDTGGGFYLRPATDGGGALTCALCMRISTVPGVHATHIHKIDMDN